MKQYDVYIGEVLAGHLVQSEEGYSYFRFSAEYRSRADRPVLGQHFEDDLDKVYRGKGLRLPPYFANIVPEGALRDVLEHSLDVPPDDDLAMLEAVGRDLPGAVTVRASEDALQEKLRTASGQDETPRQERSDEAGTGGREGLRFSLAGVQMKFSVLNRRQRVTLPGQDQLGQWIVKLDAPQLSRMTENEYATLKWADHAGFAVPECRLLLQEELPEVLREYAPAESQALLIKRYDREGEERIHQEDFAQVVGLPSRMKYEQVKYEQLATLAHAIVGRDALEKVIKRIVFMVASANFDAHLKNWSLYYPDGIRARLAPLYDQVAVVPWSERIEPKWALKLAGTKDPFQTRMATFERFAERVGIDPAEVLQLVEATLRRLADAWEPSGAAEAMPESHVDSLHAYWKRVPLLGNLPSPFGK